eukprot:tig00000334_g24107.t1
MVALTFMLYNDRHLKEKVAGPESIDKAFINGLVINEAERVDELPVVPDMKNLKVFNCRYNNVSTLHWFRNLALLEELVLSHNQISDEREFAHLGSCKRLRVVFIEGNPVFRRLGNKACRIAVLRGAPQIQVIGFDSVTEEERKEARELGPLVAPPVIEAGPKQPDGSNLIKPLPKGDNGRVYPWAGRGTAATEADRLSPTPPAPGRLSPTPPSAGGAESPVRPAAFARPSSAGVDRPPAGRASPSPALDRSPSANGQANGQLNGQATPRAPEKENGNGWRPITPVQGAPDSPLDEAERQRLQSAQNQGYLSAAVLFLLQAMRDEELISIRAVCDRRLTERAAARQALVVSPTPLAR